MKYKVSAFFALILVSAITFIGISEPDLNLDAARAVLTLEAARQGNPEILTTQSEKIRTPDARRIANTAFMLYRHISGDEKLLPCKPYDSSLLELEIIRHELKTGDVSVKDIESRVDKISSFEQRGLGYALLGEYCAKKGDTDNFKRLVKRSYVYVSASDPIIAENAVFEILRILTDFDEGEYAMSFENVALFSPERSLSFYYVGRSKKVSDYFRSVLKDTDIIKNNRMLASGMAYTVQVQNAKNATREQLERSTYHYAYQFGMSWKIKNTKNYQFPLLAYISKLAGNEENFEYYKRLSLSREQLEGMMPGYHQYVEYAGKIFALCGDYRASIFLLDTLPEGSLKNISKKRLIRSILGNEGALEAVVNEGIL